MTMTQAQLDAKLRYYKLARAVPKQRLRQMLETCVEWPELYSDLVSENFVEIGVPSRIIKNIVDGTLKFRENSPHLYNVKWVGIQPHNVIHHQKVLMTFRRAISEYNLPAYVLISIPKE